MMLMIAGTLYVVGPIAANTAISVPGSIAVMTSTAAGILVGEVLAGGASAISALYYLGRRIALTTPTPSFSPIEQQNQEPGVEPEAIQVQLYEGQAMKATLEQTSQDIENIVHEVGQHGQIITSQVQDLEAQITQLKDKILSLTKALENAQNLHRQDKASTEGFQSEFGFFPSPMRQCLNAKNQQINALKTELKLLLEQQEKSSESVNKI